MLKKILASLAKNGAEPAPKVTEERKQLAAAALMVEAANLDASFDKAEKEKIVELVRTKFHIPASDAATLIKIAEMRHEEGYAHGTFASTVRTGFSVSDCQDIIRMLWEIAYADGTLHNFEHILKRQRLEIEAVAGIIVG